jgi:hypothetical protein
MWFFATPTARKATEPPLPTEVIEQLYGPIPPDIRNYRVADPDGGVLFVGSQGTIFVGRQGAVGEGIKELESILASEKRAADWRTCLDRHTRNFVDCVKTRQRPTSCVTEMHRTLIPCHLTNIALRLGRKLQWDLKREEFVIDQEANTRLRRTQRKPYQIEG